MANTGYLIQPKLKRVTNDVDEFPLDVNGDLCSVSGLPQAVIDTPISDPRYKVYNEGVCPLPSAEVILTGEIKAPTPQIGSTNLYGAKFTVSEILDDDLIIDFTINYEDTTLGISSYTDSLTLDAGVLETETVGYVITDGSPAGFANLVINSVTPNPNGGKTITW